MKKAYLQLLVLLFLASSTLGQSFDIIEMGQELPEQDYTHYVYDSWCDHLSKNTSTTSFHYIATAKGRGKYLPKTYNKLIRKAMKMGANCFQFVSYKYDENSDMEELSLKFFQATETQLDNNRMSRDSLTIVIFADDYQDFSLKINDQVVEIPSSHFIQYSLANGNEIRIDNYEKRIIKPMTLTAKTKRLPFYLGLGNMHYDGKRTGGSSGGAAGVALGGVMGGVIAHGINSKRNAVYLPVEYGLLLKDVKKEIRIP